MRCLNSAKFTMNATLLKQNETYQGPVDSSFEGEWVEAQDPLTGQIVTEWKPTIQVPDNPETPGTNEELVATIPCVARGYSSNNRFSSTLELGEEFRNIDLLRMWIPSNILVAKGDRVTNIKDSSGTILWADISYPTPRATQFNVIGVAPQLGPFNTHTETLLFLERAEV